MEYGIISVANTSGSGPWVRFDTRAEAESCLRDCKLLSNGDYEWTSREQYNCNPYFTGGLVMAHRYRIVEL